MTFFRTKKKQTWVLFRCFQNSKSLREDALDHLDEARDVASYTRLSTSRPFGATTLDESEAEPSESAIWSSRLSLQSRRFGAEAQTEQQRPPPAHASLGRTLRHRRSPPTRHIHARQRGRGGLQQRVEHRAATLLLPLSSVKSFVHYLEKVNKDMYHMSIFS